MLRLWRRYVFLVKEVLDRMDAIDKKLNLIHHRQEVLMSTIEELKAAVARNTAVDESVITLLAGISQQLKDALATGNPAAIQEVITQLDANTQKMADAVTANTPAA